MHKVRYSKGKITREVENIRILNKLFFAQLWANLKTRIKEREIQYENTKT